MAWPSPAPAQWRETLERVLQRELEDELEPIRARQENSLRRELERIDDYFEGYERELTARAKRGTAKTAKVKTADRLAAAQAEHERRRADQLARHEIRVLPHLDALLLVAENALRAQLRVERFHQPQVLESLFVPRSRQWRTLSQGRQQ